MSGEMIWLALTVALCLVIWIPYAGLYGGLVGTKNATTDMPPHAKLPDWAQRCHRAHLNLLETLVPFAILIFMLQVLGKTGGAIATAAAIFFFARLANAIVYTAGIPYLRTAAFAVSWLACLFLLWQVFA